MLLRLNLRTQEATQVVLGQQRHIPRLPRQTSERLQVVVQHSLATLQNRSGSVRERFLRWEWKIAEFWPLEGDKFKLFSSVQIRSR